LYKIYKIKIDFNWKQRRKIMPKQIQLKSENEVLYPNPFWPVGSIFMSVNNVNPANYFGGTWAAWGTGRVPVCVNTSDSDFSSSEKTGGSKTVTLSTSQMPSHDGHVPNASYAWDDAGGRHVLY
jgi:hypothetical protein